MAPAPRLDGLRFSVVGAGRVGSSLAHWLAARGALLDWVASGTGASADGLLRALGGRRAAPAELTSAGSDLLLVAVPDPALEATALLLAARPQAAVALHVSGSRPAEVLGPLHAAGSHCGSLHPLMAFPRVRTDVGDARGLVFGIDGDAPAADLCQRLALAWEARTVSIPPAARLLYHYAATLAAGGVLTLTALAEEIADRLNLPRDLGEGYRHLAATALQAVATGRSADAITGPAARGDAALVLAQLTAAAALLPRSEPLASALAEETLRQVSREREPSAAQQALLEGLSRRLRG